MVGTQRYWDGAQWSDHIAPGGSAPQVASDSQKVNDGLLTAGWITAVFLPIVGFIIGCVLLTRRTGPAVGIMVLSVVATIFWFSQLA